MKTTAIPSVSQHRAPWPRPWSQLTALTLALTLLTGIWAQAGPAKSQAPSVPPGARDISILDQNLYVGTEFTPILVLDPADPEFPIKLLMAVAEVYQTLVTSDFPARSQVIAQKIAATKPDLVSLQEVSLIRSQLPGDFVIGNPNPATDVVLDYLGILLAALEAQGVHYQAVALVTNMDIELPMPTATQGVLADVRLTDFDVILARTDLPPGHLRVSEPFAGNFETALQVGKLGLTLPRGWCGVDVTTRGRTFRFVNAHLEENTSPVIQAAQAQELLNGPADTSLPMILVGDFNSDANGNDGTTSYGLLTESFTDTWSVLHPQDPGNTWGHDPLLADPSAEFIWRLDLILYRGAQFQPVDMWIFSPQFQDTRPLWPSDHKGMAARFRIR